MLRRKPGHNAPACVAEYGIGEHELAEKHLQQFLEMYEVDDGFRRNALSVLQQLQRR